MNIMCYAIIKKNIYINLIADYRKTLQAMRDVAKGGDRAAAPPILKKASTYCA